MTVAAPAIIIRMKIITVITTIAPPTIQMIMVVAAMGNSGLKMNDVSLNWKKISRGLPKAKNSSSERAPTMEEIRKLVNRKQRDLESSLVNATSRLMVFS